MLKLYGFSRVNAGPRGKTRDLRVLWALEEMQLPFEQIPSIDDDGIVLSESGAILLYLAKKSGRLIPADRAGEAQVLRWSFAALNSVEPPLLGLMVLGWTTNEGCDKHREFMTGWAHRVLGNLERWMAGREFVATDEFTVADILMAHVLSVVKDELTEPYPKIRAYRDRCFARPAWKRAIEAYCARVEAA